MKFDEVKIVVINIILKIINEEILFDEAALLQKIEEEHISLGLSSLDLMDLIIQVEMEFGIEIDPERYTELYDVKSLIQIIIQQLEIKSDEDKELHSIQEALFN